MTESHPRIIAFDFDGVIATYEGFVAHNHVRDPNPEILRAIDLLKEKGYKIMVHSTRGDTFLEEYCKRFSIPVDYINRHSFRQGENPGKPIAFVYVDDRAICYRGDTAESLVSQIDNFKAYWQS